MTIGKILEIWRYPVSSLGGEMCHRAEVTAAGIRGDREYALFDPRSGSVAAPETEARWRPALFLRSAFDEDGVKIGFPDDSWRFLNDPQLAPQLAEHFGFDVAVGRYADRDTRTASLPQLNQRYGLAPIHLLTTASLRELERAMPGTAIDCRRFRPNIVVDDDPETGFTETHWIGDSVHIDDVVCRVTEPTKRCGMTFIAQPGLDERAEILRTVVRQNRRSLGVYCEVMTEGVIERGAVVTREITAA